MRCRVGALPGKSRLRFRADGQRDRNNTGNVNFAFPQIQTMLLRAIAWAGKKPINTLVDYQAPTSPMRPAAAPTGP